MIDNKLSSANVDLMQNIRVIRNFLQATRQRNETKYNTNIRINYFGSYWILFSQLLGNNIYTKLQDSILNNKGTQISDVSLKNEIEKAKIIESNSRSIQVALTKLEEFSFFGGLIHQLKPSVNYSKFPDYSKAIEDIWSDAVNDTLIIQALIACGFSGLKIKNTKMGETYYFGKKGNWDVILTSEEASISSSILLLLDSYNNSSNSSIVDKLVEIKNNWLTINNTDRSYKYYFLKYPEFTSRLNYYVRPNDYEIRMLGTDGVNPLLAYHISPLVLTVCQKIRDNNKCEERYCYNQHSGNSPLILKNGMTLTSTNDGWVINNNDIINEALIAKHNLILINNNYLLTDNAVMDRIEVAVHFINDIYS